VQVFRQKEPITCRGTSLRRFAETPSLPISNTPNLPENGRLKNFLVTAIFRQIRGIRCRGVRESPSIALHSQGRLPVPAARREHLVEQRSSKAPSRSVPAGNVSFGRKARTLFASTPNRLFLPRNGSRKIKYCQLPFFGKKSLLGVEQSAIL
jgi:hypothetical protein